MGIKITFSAEAPLRKRLVSDIEKLAEQEQYKTGRYEEGIKIVLCPTGAILIKLLEANKKWKITGECYPIPAGAGFHKAAIEFIDLLGQSLFSKIEVQDPTDYYIQRDFRWLQEDYYNPLLKQLISGFKKILPEHREGMFLCWAPEQYEPKMIPNTLVSHVGRFSFPEFKKQSLKLLASRYFIWMNAEKDALFYRNSALNLLWEHCRYLSSASSLENAASNREILDDLETAARLDPTLPLPLASYREVCVLDEREPTIPDTVPELHEDFTVGYRKQEVTHILITLRLVLPGVYSHEWEKSDAYESHLFTVRGQDTPTWRISIFDYGNAKMDLSKYLHFLNLRDFEKKKLSGGTLGWGWTKEEDLYSIIGILTSDDFVYLISVVYSREDERAGLYEQIRKIRLFEAFQ